VDQTLHIVQAYRGNPIDATAALFCVFLVLAMCTSFGRRMLLRPFTYLARPALHFEPYERSAGWFGTMDSQRYRVSLTATWKVTNTSRRSVVLKDFYMKGLATEHHILSVDGSQDAIIPPRGCINLEAFCMVRKTLTWRSGTFTADVSLIDSRGEIRTLKNVKYNHIKQTGFVDSPQPTAPREANPVPAALISPS
jgi:hypothetical protein